MERHYYGRPSNEIPLWQQSVGVRRARERLPMTFGKRIIGLARDEDGQVFPERYKGFILACTFGEEQECLLALVENEPGEEVHPDDCHEVVLEATGQIYPIVGHFELRIGTKQDNASCYTLSCHEELPFGVSKLVHTALEDQGLRRQDEL